MTLRPRAAQSLVRSLEGKLSSLALEISGDIPELVVTIDGVAVPRDELAATCPVDAGTRRVVAEAAGYESWSEDVIVPADPPESIRVVVTLTPQPSETPTPVDSDDAEEQAHSSWSVQVAPVAAGAMLSGRF